MTVNESADHTALVLAAVLERSPRTLTELAEAVGLAAIDVPPLVAALERHDLVTSGAEGVRPGTAALRFARSGRWSPRSPPPAPRCGSRRNGFASSPS